MENSFIKVYTKYIVHVCSITLYSIHWNILLWWPFSQVPYKSVGQQSYLTLKKLLSLKNVVIRDWKKYLSCKWIFSKKVFGICALRSSFLRINISLTVHLPLSHKVINNFFLLVGLKAYVSNKVTLFFILEKQRKLSLFLSLHILIQND